MIKAFCIRPQQSQKVPNLEHIQSKGLEKAQMYLCVQKEEESDLPLTISASSFSIIPVSSKRSFSFSEVFFRSCRQWMRCFLPVWFRLEMTCLNNTLAVCNLPCFKGSVFYIVCKNPFWVNFLQMKAVRTTFLLHCTPARTNTTLLKSLFPMNITHSGFAESASIICFCRNVKRNIKSFKIWLS